MNYTIPLYLLQNVKKSFEDVYLDVKHIKFKLMHYEIPLLPLNKYVNSNRQIK